MSDLDRWMKRYQITPEKLEIARLILEKVRDGKVVVDAMRAFPLPQGGYLSKSVLVAEYRRQVESGEIEVDNSLLERIRMKPMRTLSGVTTVTVLTKPYPCPGKCIFSATTELLLCLAR